MASRLLVDASLIIDLLRGLSDASAYLGPLLVRRVVVSHPAIISEVLSGARDQRHLRSLDAALSPLPLLRVRSSDFDASLNLLRTYRLSTGIGWADCLIAATALRLDIPFVTLNDKHFRPIRGLTIIRPY